jgi:hypothetical protein
MVELAGLAEPERLPNAVAQALGMKLDGTGAVRDELVERMAPRRALLVLDYCERLLDAVAELVHSLVRGAPDVAALSTSQEPLHVPTERQYRVTPPAVPSGTTVSGARELGAVALFETRVRITDPRFAPNDENMAAVIGICRRRDGLPLAIELAAEAGAGLASTIQPDALARPRAAGAALGDGALNALVSGALAESPPEAPGDPRTLPSGQRTPGQSPDRGDARRARNRLYPESAGRRATAPARGNSRRRRRRYCRISSFGPSGVSSTSSVLSLR